MKTIGILGGLGPQATIDFEFRLHKVSQQIIPQHTNEGYPPVIVYYFREAPMLLDKNQKPILPLQPNPKLLEATKFLALKSDFLVIPSNTPHFFKDEIEIVSGKKLVSIVDVTIEEINRRKLKKVGVLAIGLTLQNKLYQSVLDQNNIAWEIISSELAEELDKAIFSVMEGRENENSRKIARKAVEYLRKKDVGGIILGCTVIPLLLKEEPDLINPSQLLTEAAVHDALL